MFRKRRAQQEVRAETNSSSPERLFFASAPAILFAALTLVFFCAMLPGCNWLRKPAELLSAPFQEKPELTTAEMGPAAIDAALLAKDDWVLAPPDPRRLQDPAMPNLVNPALEPIFAVQGTARANLLPTLEHPDAPVRANAAIGLARWGDGRALVPLV